MSTTAIDTIVSNYLSRLEALLAGLPAPERRQLISEIREHVQEARAALPEETEASVREVLDRVGTPEDIAREALGENPRRLQADAQRDEVHLHCSFCGRPATRRRTLVRRRDGLQICNGCVDRVIATLATSGADAHDGEPAAGAPPSPWGPAEDDPALVARELPEAAARAALGAPADGPPRRAGRLVLAAAALVVIVVAAVLGVVLSGSAAPAGVASAPTATVGGFPTGIAVDPASGTAYVASGVASDLTVINTATCNASSHVGCAASKTVSTGGQDAIGVVVDDQNGTVYAVNGSGSVALINARTCNARDTRGCAQTPALVDVPGGPEFLALDATTDTVYVADTSSGTVSVIDAKTCNAGDHSGCGRAPASVSVGEGAFPIAADPSSNTIYVGTLGGGLTDGAGNVAMIDGARCDAETSSGCAATPRSLSVGSDPGGIALDPTTGTVYVSSENGTVSILDASSCNATVASGCAHPATVAAQADPRGDAIDPSTHTLYVTNAGSNSVSMIDTATCNATHPAGCAAVAPSFPVGESPRRIALDASAHTAYVVDTGGDDVAMINTRACNATDQRGCPTQPVAGVLPGGSGRGAPIVSAPLSDSSCSPVTVAATSGAPAATLTASATQVASGSLDGQTWTLWSEKGQTGADGLEDGGLVLGGRAYHLCPGYRNPAELELLDTGTHTVVYGVIGYPGRATIKLTTGATGTFTPGKPLPTPTVQLVNGVSFFIGTLPKPACSYSALELDSTSGKVSAEHNLGFSGCTTDKLAPITFSQGIWQLPAGHFVNNFGGGRLLAPGVPIANVPLSNSSCSPLTVAATSGAPAATLTASATQVASGSLDGQTWTLWSEKGQTGADGLEDGGLVLGGRAYHLCPGYRNPAELELLDTGTHTVVYGVIGYPGRATIKLTTGATGTFTPGKPLPTPTVQLVNGVSFFIGTLPKPACSYSALELDSTSGKVSAEHNLGFSSCTTDKLAPITFSQGIWQLPAGHFVNNFGGGLAARGPSPLLSVPGLNALGELALTPPSPGPAPSTNQCAQAWNTTAPTRTLHWVGGHDPLGARIGTGEETIGSAPGRTSGPICTLTISFRDGSTLHASGAWSRGTVPAWRGVLLDEPLLNGASMQPVEANGTIRPRR